MAHLRHLASHYSKYWSLQNAFSVQSKFLFVFNSAILQLPPAKSYLGLSTSFHWFFINVEIQIWWHTSYMACLFIRCIIVCFAEMVLNPGEKQNSLQTISFFNLNYFFQYIWDETLNFEFKLVYDFNMYLPFIWKNDVQNQKETGWIYVYLLSTKLELYTYWFAKIGLSVQYLFLFGIATRPKRGARGIVQLLLSIQKRGCTDLETACEKIWFKRFYWSLLPGIQ